MHLQALSHPAPLRGGAQGAKTDSRCLAMLNFFWHTYDLPRIRTPIGEASVALDRWDPALHLGRTEDGGRYCVPCGRTLCVGGIRSIASARPEDWYAACPDCGAIPSGKVQLFRWRQDPLAVRRVCRARHEESLVIDEHGTLYTGRGFVVVTGECGLHWVEGHEPIRPWH